MLIRTVGDSPFRCGISLKKKSRTVLRPTPPGKLCVPSVVVFFFREPKGNKITRLLRREAIVMQSDMRGMARRTRVLHWVPSNTGGGPGFGIWKIAQTKLEIPSSQSGYTLPLAILISWKLGERILIAFKSQKQKSRCDAVCVCVCFEFGIRFLKSKYFCGRGWERIWEARPWLRNRVRTHLRYFWKRPTDVVSGSRSTWSQLKSLAAWNRE